jgi:hypothetical protein
MRPLWIQGTSYAGTPVATLKRWVIVLHKHLCYTLGESNKKVQEHFGKLSSMKGADEKFKEAIQASATAVQVPRYVDAGQKKGRGASKKRM